MRDKKFRGKRIDNGEWVNGNLIVTSDGHCIIQPWIRTEGVGYTHPNAGEVDPESVGQYIKVHDDEPENELYEGDIIEMVYQGEKVVGSIQYEGGGYILASDDFVDGFMWVSDLTENDGRYFWIPTAVLIGNMTDDGDSYCCT